MNKKDYLISQFYCTQCGRRGIPLRRPREKQREPGHLKNLFCIWCKKKTNHTEVRSFGQYTYDTFLIEFKEGNFTEEGNRKEEWKKFVREHRRWN